MRGERGHSWRDNVTNQVRLTTLLVLLVVGLCFLGVLDLIAIMGHPSGSNVDTEYGLAMGALLAMVAISGGALMVSRMLAAENLDLDRMVDAKTVELMLANQKLAATLSDLEEAYRAKQDFVANVSHELRTPLTLIKAAAAALGRGDHELAPSKRVSMLQRIDSGTERLSRLVEDLLAYSRIESGALRLDIERGDPVEAVEQTVHLLLPLAASRGIAIAVGPFGGVPAISFDRHRLGQVVLNLVENAIKFTPNGGRIDVVISPASDGAQITIADNGRGIAPEHLPHIFERFYQADRSITRQFGGTGLGLAVVKNLVALHGGTVKVESTEGKGATFTVWLPETPPQPQEEGSR